MKPQITKLTLSLATILTLGVTSIQAQNLIQNGSFEDFTVLKEKAKWKKVTLNNWSGEAKVATNQLGLSATSQAHKLMVDGTKKFNSFTQTINTVEGTSYQVALDAYAGRRNLASSDIEVLVDGELIATIKPTRQWAEYNATFEGSGGEQEFTIQEVATQNNRRGAFVDNVRVTSADVPVVKPTILDRGIVSASDDAEESSYGGINLNSSDLELTMERSKQEVGMRFTNLTIPKDMRILKAYIQFTVDETNSDATNLKIYGHKVANAPTFSQTNNNISSRVKTSASIGWSPEAWTVVGAKGTAQQSADLTSVVQELVDQESWYSGNAMAFIVTGEGKRVAQSFNKSATNSAHLYVTYVPKSADLGSLDSDNDGLINSVDSDDDNDGILDSEDAFPLNASESVDTDGDGIGNNADSDDDNDGVSDEEELAQGTDPLDKDSFPIVDSKNEPIVQYHRVVWDSDPAHQATIGFTPKTDTKDFYVKYGYNTDESTWNSQDVDVSSLFRGSLIGKFVHLENLQADSSVYYRVCNSDGCGQNLWFRTAPTDNSPFVVIAGGDTRSGWNTRRAGNAIVAKTRPLFVMHGGDYTNSNSAREMSQFLTDWALTFSKDSIDSTEYSRIYPLVPAHGNHEDGDFRTLCRVFGIDSNKDGECTESDTFGAFDVSPLLRVYTLNSQFQNSGWSSYATQMNDWLDSDLTSKGAEVKWRIVQYHKPMFPHYSGKPNNPTLFNWWAELFYNNAVNLVVESDTHIAKTTKVVKPLGNSYAETSEGGTVYVGEGSWGAPARSANKARSWTLDLASIQQFKVVTVTPNHLDVKTAQFDATASTLSKSDRDNNSTVLPTGINWWSAKDKGTNIRLLQSAEGRSVME